MSNNKPLVRQRLQLLQRGDRTSPSIYRYRKNEVLCFYAGGDIHICDAGTMVVTNELTAQDVKDMGYNPVKMLRGEREDMFLDNDTVLAAGEVVMNSATNLMMLLVGVIILSYVFNAVGCTSFVLHQIEKDIAVTMIYPVDNLIIGE